MSNKGSRAFDGGLLFFGILLSTSSFGATELFINTASEAAPGRFPAQAAPMENVQPYIDKLKNKMDADSSEKGSESSSTDSYTESVRKKLDKKDDTSSEGYSEKLRSKIPSEKVEDQPYTEKIKSGLEPKEAGGAIKALHEGRSELQAKRMGADIHNLWGFKYGAYPFSRGVAGNAAGYRSFNEVYGTNYAPEFSFYYEYQPFHSEKYGNFGIYGQGGLGYFTGNGAFASGGIDVDTRFTFLQVPLSAGVSFRLNTLKFVRPYVLVGPSAVVWLETRSDKSAYKRGYSLGFYGAVGAAISLDWLGSAWDLYMEHGIHHYYLTCEYSLLKTFIGNVTFDTSHLFVGLAYEF